jgi:hypothetical protein
VTDKCRSGQTVRKPCKINEFLAAAANAGETVKKVVVTIDAADATVAFSMETKNGVSMGFGRLNPYYKHISSISIKKQLGDTFSSPRSLGPLLVFHATESNLPGSLFQSQKTELHKPSSQSLS